MGYSTEVKAVLGIDSSKLPGEMQKARQVFQDGTRAIEGDSAKAGKSAGASFVGGIEQRLLNMRNLSGVLVSALGFNIEKIANSIAAGIVGGSEEAWKAAAEIADQNSKLIAAQIEKNLSPAQLADQYRREIEKANAKAEEIGKQGKVQIIDQLTGSTTRTLNAEQAKAQNEAIQQAIELTGKLKDLTATMNKDAAKAADDLAKAQRRYDDEHGTAQQRIGRLNADILNLQWDMEAVGITKAERDTKQIQLLDKMTEREKELKDLAEKKADQEKKISDQKARQLSLEEDLRKQKITVKDAENKLTDRTKLTVGELANVRGKPKSAIEEDAAAAEERRRQAFAFGANEGLTQEVIDARAKAGEVLTLEKKAEEQRLTGDRVGAAETNIRIGEMRDSLVKSGFTKSTEGNPAGPLLADIKTATVAVNATLGKIEDILKGKFANE